MYINIIVAVSYFYFNWSYFRLVSKVLRFPPMPKIFVAGSFLVNYAMFFLCSILQFNLLVNWGLFFLVLLTESFFYCRKEFQTALFFSMNGILYGLTINVFCRCAVAIYSSQPLMSFDNSITSLKALPVFLGFLFGGVVFHMMALRKTQNSFRVVLDHPGHLKFQLEIMAGMFLYLYLNLLLYQTPGNSIVLKLWGIKSCIFSLAGAGLGMRYSLKMCRLADYREQNRDIRRKIEQKEREERELRSTAYCDALTGTYNRQYIREQLKNLLQKELPFALCFLDLDNLKGVNDSYGHGEGDRYLITAARELELACRQGRDLIARYGGDEFLILFTETGAIAAEERVRQADERIRAISRKGEVPFEMSFSYGIVDSSVAADADALIAEADKVMYDRKSVRRVTG
ncbi:GGDEF domain-containing protein [Dorea sp. D27]|uniref:GGDEF domain-containing protein n=1 Tax=Dorea sp. D27 TaxID=658665 RepID=UPI0006731E09|nr:GGDEF domain-containing protein [Dorea sp. D27]